MKFKPAARYENIVVQETENEVLIYDLSSNKAVCLNQSAASVWKMCDGKKDISTIARILELREDRIISEDLVWLTIDQLKAEGLLLNGDSIRKRFEGLSRRDLIKRVGLTSMVALPIVSSIAAPTAAAAQSVCAQPIGQCTVPNVVNVCPPECTGSTINATFYDLDNTCMTVSGMNSFLCTGAPRIFNEHFTIDSIT